MFRITGPQCTCAAVSTQGMVDPGAASESEGPQAHTSVYSWGYEVELNHPLKGGGSSILAAVSIASGGRVAPVQDERSVIFDTVGCVSSQDIVDPGVTSDGYEHYATWCEQPQPSKVAKGEDVEASESTGPATRLCLTEVHGTVGYLDGL